MNGGDMAHFKEKGCSGKTIFAGTGASNENGQITTAAPEHLWRGELS
jgi:hypothetical protein